MPERPDFDIYKDLVLKDFEPTISYRSAEQKYKMNMNLAKNTIETNTTYSNIMNFIRSLDNVYMKPNSGLLFAQNMKDVNSLNIKPFDSAMHKIFRNNILFNRYWPKDPKKGKIGYENMFSEIDDLLRTRFVCKYMDGPKFICDSLGEHCKDKDIEYDVRNLSNDEGYYGWHFYFKISTDIQLKDEVQNVNMHVEIQFQTQLSEAISHLTHGLYEEKRATGFDSEKAWKWEPESQQFRSAYLGHGLHLLEGLIQNFRDEVLEKHHSESDNS